MSPYTICTLDGIYIVITYKYGFDFYKYYFILLNDRNIQSIIKLIDTNYYVWIVMIIIQLNVYN